MVLITSWNCNGLCNVDKMKRVFNLFDDRNYDIIALQEISLLKIINMYGTDKFTTIMWTHPLKKWHFLLEII